jgi:hypothetical protein
MKILTFCVMSALALTAASSAFAADANKVAVTRDFTDTVEPAQQQAYEAGVKAYNQCLRDHGVKYDEYTVTHETGDDTYKYSSDIGPYIWADFDALDAAAKPCSATWHTKANPYLKSESSVFMVDQSDMSHMPADWEKQAPPALLNVIYYTLKPGHEAMTAFTDAAKKIAAAAAKSKWPYYFRALQVRGGDAGAPDYVLVIPEKSWADYGTEPSPSLWKMVESAYGKADTAALRKSLNDSIKDSSSHVDRYSADLSYIAGK